MTYQELTFSDLTDDFSFHKGDKILPSQTPVGQEVALKALRYGLEIQAPQSHFFCMGPKGVGRTTLTLQVLNRYAEKHTLKNDWVLGANFSCPTHPFVLPLPVGQGLLFVHQMAQSVLSLRQNLQKVFYQKNYLNKVQELEEFFQHKKEKFLSELESHFIAQNIALVQSGTGYGLCPVINKKIYDSDAFNTLSQKIRQKMIPFLEKARKELAVSLKKILEIEDEKNQTIEKLNHLFLTHQIEKAFTPLQTKYKKQTEVIEYLLSVNSFLSKNALFLMDETEAKRIWPLLQLNPFLCSDESKSLPVICPVQVDMPSLVGKLDQENKNLPLHMCFSSGLLYQANNGFLVLNAQELFNQKDLFYVLKQALFTHRLSFLNQISLDIPLDLKVVLIGSNKTYEELKNTSEDFSELFKVVVPFSEQMVRTKQNEKRYLGELAHFAESHHLKSFSLPAYHALLNYASRLALQPKTNLSLYFSILHELMRSADYFARQAKAHQVQALHVHQALDEQKERESTNQKQWLNHLSSGLLHMDVHSMQVGRVNTLSICSCEDKKFGRVSGMNATTCAGEGKITDIEGQINFGGPVHAKGILILQNYLKAHFGQREAMKLDASLGFEQSYGPVDGDSASSAELCALMSAIGYIPLKQSLALTGAINVFGQVGAVAGINEKIEGFFDVCQTLGFHVSQGVIFPKACVPELLLKEDIVQAVKSKKFHLYPVETIEECMEILSGLNKKAIDEKISTAWHHAYLNAKNNLFQGSNQHTHIASF